MKSKRLAIFLLLSSFIIFLGYQIVKAQSSSFTAKYESGLLWAQQYEAVVGEERLFSILQRFGYSMLYSTVIWKGQPWETRFGEEWIFAVGKSV